MTGAPREVQVTGRGVFRILCVCTGNVCRSPAAERLLASALGPTVIVSSAGTGALVGQPISPPMDDHIRRHGGESGGFAARQLSESMVSEADLVLALTRQHRRAVVELAPSAVQRCFTLREYARLLSQSALGALPGTPADRARQSLRTVAAGRRQSTAAEDDVDDPYRRGDAAYTSTFTDIEQAVSRIVRILAG